MNLPRLSAILRQARQVLSRSLNFTKTTVLRGVGRLNSWLRPAIRNVMTILDHIDVLSMTGNINGKREAAQILLIPLGTFGAIFALASAAGVAQRPGCNVATNFAYILFLQPKGSYHCAALPFLSDIPMVLLSFTCPFAFVLYRLVRRRLASIPTALAATGLLQDSALQAAASHAVQRLEE